MLFFKKLDLQLFGGEGAASGGGSGEGAAPGGAATVANAGSPVAADDGQQHLRELGVPEDMLKRRAARSAARGRTPAVTTAGTDISEGSRQVAAANANNVTENAKADETTATNVPTDGGKSAEGNDTAPARMSWNDIMKDPEYNAEMQKIIKARVKESDSAKDALAKLTPALEVLARAHKMDPAKLDYDALSKAISDDSHYYEDRALELGTSVDTAKRIDQMERENERIRRENARTLEMQKARAHLMGLEREGEELKKLFPSFDLRIELQNPTFRRLTAPNVGISVQDAYFAVHRAEIQTAAMQTAAQKTAEKMSNAIASGTARPIENGTSQSSASVTKFDYAKASPAERAALKQRIREAAAEGKKVYPGG